MSEIGQMLPLLFFTIWGISQMHEGNAAMKSNVRNSDCLYDDLVWPIALLIYCRCADEGDEKAFFPHLADNRFEIPSDILTRLGIMEEVGSLRGRSKPHYHKFVEGWQPSNGSLLKRHDGEPTIFDLISTLCFILDWDAHYFPRLPGKTVSELSKPPPQLDISDDRRFAGSEHFEFHEYAFRLGVEQIIKLGLGNWKPDGGGFELVYSLRTDTPIGLVDTYWEAHFNLINRFGSDAYLYPPK